MRGIKPVFFDNGLTLLMEKRSYAGSVVLSIATKSGSINENEEESGITHVFEHTLFLSNAKRSYYELTEELESAGADINASTCPNVTRFYADTLPSEISKTLNILYEAVVSNSYDKEEFYREIDNILSEMKNYKDNPLAHLYYNFFLPTLFKRTPLAKKVDGSVKSVKNLTPQQLVAHKRKIFVPNRPMLIVVVGKYDEEEVIKQTQKTFGSLPKGTPVTFSNISCSNKKNRRIERRSGIDQAYLNMGFRVPSYSHLDAVKILLLQNILTGSLSSRLFKELRYKRGIGYIVTSTLESFEVVGSLCFEVSIKNPSRLNEVEEVISTEFNDLKTNLVGSQELQRVKNLIIKAHQKDLLLPERRAELLTMHEFQRMPFDFRKLEYYVQRISATSLREAARKYLTEDYTLCALVPR